MGVRAREAPSYSGIHGLYDIEIGGKQDVEVALMNLESMSEFHSLESA